MDMEGIDPRVSDLVFHALANGNELTALSLEKYFKGQIAIDYYSISGYDRQRFHFLDILNVSSHKAITSVPAISIVLDDHRPQLDRKQHPRSTWHRPLEQRRGLLFP
jgi:hypothetical protein